jgi:hypothetical protein
MNRELDFLVAPFSGPVHAGDQAGAVDPTEVAVAEAVTRLGSLPAPSVSPRCHSAYSSHKWGLEECVLGVRAWLHVPPVAFRRRTGGRR